MQRIVINKCFGGFALSRQAFLALRKAGCSAALEEPDIGEFYADGSGPRMDYGGMDSYLSDIDRNSPELLAIIDKKGARWCSGSCAELAVVEIPDGVEWTIEEYDGQEWIAEKHRTWR